MSGSAAMSLADGDGEGMKLVEKTCMVFFGVGGEGLTGEADQGFIAFAIAAGRGR